MNLVRTYDDESSLSFSHSLSILQYTVWCVEVKLWSCKYQECASIWVVYALDSVSLSNQPTNSMKLAHGTDFNGFSTSQRAEQMWLEVVFSRKQTRHFATILHPPPWVNRLVPLQSCLPPSQVDQPVSNRMWPCFTGGALPVVDGIQMFFVYHTFFLKTRFFASSLPSFF